MQISKYLGLDQLTASMTAKKNKINNLPNATQIENLKHISSNIFDKLHDHFNGNVTISSGFRNAKLNKLVNGSANSQHMSGQALDIKGKNGVTNAEIFYYIQKNFTYDQLIWEFGTMTNPNWVHVSLTKNKNRGQVFAIGDNVKKKSFQ